MLTSDEEELEEVLGLPFNEAFPYVEPDDVDDEIKQEYCLRESVENIDDEYVPILAEGELKTDKEKENNNEHN